MSKELGKNKVILAIVFAVVFVVIGILFQNSGSSLKNEYLDEIVKTVGHVIENNGYIQMEVGEQKYIYLLYNSSGEALAEANTGGVAFYRSDNKIISISDTTTYIEYDLSPLHFIKAVAKVADNNTTDCKVETADYNDEDTGSKYTTVKITVNGKENIKAIYDTVGDEAYSEESINMLYSGFEDVETSYLTLAVSIGEDKELGSICNITFGEEANTFTSWKFDGYIEMFDWKMEDAWYSDNSTDNDAWIALAEKLLDEISAKTDEYMKSNNIVDDTTEIGSLSREDYIEMGDEEKLAVLGSAVMELQTYSVTLDCEVAELKVELDSYYEINTDEINLLQAIINIGTEKGWLVEYSN